MILARRSYLTLTYSEDDNCIYYILSEYFRDKDEIAIGSEENLEPYPIKLTFFDEVGNVLYEFNPTDNNQKVELGYDQEGYRGKLSIGGNSGDMTISKLRRMNSFKAEFEYRDKES